MMRALPAPATEACRHCPAFREGLGATLQASEGTVLPSLLATQVEEGAWSAVVTTRGRGMFLIRRREGVQADACPLTAYEIRHSATQTPPEREQVVNSADGRMQNGAWRERRVRVGTKPG